MRLAIVVEGRTEEEFVNGLLSNELQNYGIEITPILLNGNVTIGCIARNMSKLFWDFGSVTSFVDFYGFNDKGSKSPRALQAEIDKSTKSKIRRSYDESKVFSYIQQYEFEGLLFSNTEVVDQLFGHSRQYGIELRRIRSRFQNPEEINDHPQTTPSRQLKRVLPKYRKVLHGPLIAMETGLTVIRSECPRFGAWVSRLESLGRSN